MDAQRRRQMFFDKQAVLDHIIEQAGPELAAQAEQMLPDLVDHEQHAGLLQQFGIDPQNMVSQLGQQSGQGGYGRSEQSGYNQSEQGGYGQSEQGGYGQSEQGGYNQSEQGGDGYGDRDREPSGGQ
jgi:hypothetical protein